MSSLFHFGRPTQAPQGSRSPREGAQAHAPATPGHGSSLGSSLAPNYRAQPQKLTDAELYRQYAAEAVRQLDVAACRVLVEVASALLLGDAEEVREPYVPQSLEDTHVAAWLAEPHVGLLVSQPAGYVRCYTLSTVGRLVVRAFLTDYLMQRAAETGVHSASHPAVHQQPSRGGGLPYGR